MSFYVQLRLFVRWVCVVMHASEDWLFSPWQCILHCLKLDPYRLQSQQKTEEIRPVMLSHSARPFFMEMCCRLLKDGTGVLLPTSSLIWNIIPVWPWFCLLYIGFTFRNVHKWAVCKMKANPWGQDTSLLFRSLDLIYSQNFDDHTFKSLLKLSVICITVEPENCEIAYSYKYKSFHSSSLWTSSRGRLVEIFINMDTWPLSLFICKQLPTTMQSNS